ncbi:ComEC/Rec2 family competence protein [Clostridium tunisiense]|uniref:ComEC/Rec2 family competence protein n=1 Tax=Clostridium tunisiense TaxID=219748 RepID=UPI00031A4EBD|nr:ComEC/Rec2 family competence protein [Clostridium tunisiense]
MKKRLYLIPFTVVILIICFSFIGKAIALLTNSSNSSHYLPLNYDLKVHFLNVGQGDCILIQSYDKNLLIDSGPNTSSKKVIRYLHKQNIKKLDYVIATHPHEDHIGAMDDIISNFTVDNFFAPKIASHNTDFLNLVTELSKKNKKINVSKSGLEFNINENTKLTFLSPQEDNYDNLNNYSTVIKLQFKQISFLFTGDSEKLIEDELIKGQADLAAQVLKIGHHGSKTSSSKNFVSRVNPTYAVISCGLGNDYGHPDKVTLNTLTELKIKGYRTDKQGDIIFASDGKNLSSFTANIK